MAHNYSRYGFIHFFLKKERAHKTYRFNKISLFVHHKYRNEKQESCRQYVPLAFHHCANTTFPRTLFYFSLLSASIIFSYSSVLLDFVIASFLWSQEMCNFQVRTEFPPSTSPFIQGSTHWCNTSRINIRISDPFSPV